MQEVLEVKGLTKHYPSFSLQDLTFSIPKGCVAGFIGLNGQGKTTTIRTILGLAKKEKGKVYFFGKDFEKEEKSIKEELGIVFDQGYLYENLTCHQMKNLVATLYPRWDETRYIELMQKFTLNGNQKINTLSKGMKMKYSLILALSHHCSFLIMDEPTSGLDPLIRKETLEILSTFMEKEGLGVFYSTHITSDLERFADIIIFIHEGKILMVEEKDTLLDQHRLVKGRVDLLTNEIREKFISLKEGNFSFEGITKNGKFINEKMRDSIIEKPTIEDIMVAYVDKGGFQ